MKGFPSPVPGPLGPWYKKVNEAVAQVRVGTTSDELIQLLGDPDERRAGRSHPLKFFQELMDRIAGGPTRIRYGTKDAFDVVLVYFDPYRPRRHYAFGISRGVIAQAWQETQSRQ